MTTFVREKGKMKLYNFHHKPAIIILFRNPAQSLILVIQHLNAECSFYRQIFGGFGSLFAVRWYEKDLHFMQYEYEAFWICTQRCIYHEWMQPTNLHSPLCVCFGCAWDNCAIYISYISTWYVCIMSKKICERFTKQTWHVCITCMKRFPHRSSSTNGQHTA